MEKILVRCLFALCAALCILPCAQACAQACALGLCAARCALALCAGLVRWLLQTFRLGTKPRTPHPTAPAHLFRPSASEKRLVHWLVR